MHTRRIPVASTSSTDFQSKGKGGKKNAVSEARQIFNPDQKDIERSNSRKYASTMQIASDDITQQAQIVQIQVAETSLPPPAEENKKAPRLKCGVRNCNNDLEFISVDQLLAHYNANHPGARLSDARCSALSVRNCKHCKQIHKLDSLCSALLTEKPSNVVDFDNPTYPQESWSITVTANKTDLPRQILTDFKVFMEYARCGLYIASLERGDKENNLHMQAAAEICWDREDAKGLAKLLRQHLHLDSELFDSLTFKLQCKPFQSGQSWLAMIGYCQKWKGNREYEMISAGMTAEDLKKGQVHLQVYRSDYTKDKFVLDTQNILKASYAFWTATTKPVFSNFVDNMEKMLESGDYVVSGKLLTSHVLDAARTEASWSTLLKPYEVDKRQVNQIFFGTATKKVTRGTTVARYSLDQFHPSPQDETLIAYLKMNLLKRRHNIVLVGPAGCGKTCLIEALTAKYGVQFFGTGDELKELSNDVQFVVFDDFDFQDFNVDDLKRLLDRESHTQRVKVRYHDAELHNKMTRVVLCNSLPELFENEAVKSRTEILYVHNSLFPASNKRKFRGTHLLDEEEFEDDDNDDAAAFPELAFSYKATTTTAAASQAKFDAELKSKGTFVHPHDCYTAAEIKSFADSALIKPHDNALPRTVTN